MEVEIEGKSFKLVKRDRLIIPGNTTHSVLIGPTGYFFFWSEKST